MSVPTILLVNGNSQIDLTARMARRAEARSAGQAVIEPMTIAGAPRYVATRADAAVAGGAIVEGVRARMALTDAPRPDAVMLACFGEPGLWALRDTLAVPVTGMVEASVAAALQLGRRLSVLTSGQDWPCQIADLLALYGLASRVERVTALPAATSLRVHSRQGR